MFPSVHTLPRFIARGGRNALFKPSSILRALPLSVVKAAALAAVHFCEPRAVTWSAGQEDMGKQAQAVPCWRAKLQLCHSSGIVVTAAVLAGHQGMHSEMS